MCFVYHQNGSTGNRNTLKQTAWILQSDETEILQKFKKNCYHEILQKIREKQIGKFWNFCKESFQNIIF
jgi:hypothetical protein